MPSFETKSILEDIGQLQCVTEKVLATENTKIQKKYLFQSGRAACLPHCRSNGGTTFKARCSVHEGGS